MNKKKILSLINLTKGGEERRGDELFAPNWGFKEVGNGNSRREKMHDCAAHNPCASLLRLSLTSCFILAMEHKGKPRAKGSRNCTTILGGKKTPKNNPQTTHRAFARRFPCSRGCFIHHFLHRTRGWEAGAASMRHRKSITTGGKLNNRSNRSPRRRLVTAEANRGSLFTYLPFPHHH